MERSQPPPQPRAYGVDGATVAIVIAILLVVIALYYRARLRREGFASRRAQEVYRVTRELFDRADGLATYSEYKTKLQGADPVLYTDLRRLWGEKRFSPEEVARVI